MDEFMLAAEMLRSGHIICFPTDTLYGIGCDAFNEESVEEVFRLKGRPRNNPFLVLIADERQLQQVACDVPEEARQLMKRFWPGPLTIVLKKHPGLPDIVTAGGDTVAVRMPGDERVLRMLHDAGRPIIAPSANPSGAAPAKTAAEAKQHFPDIFVVDGGPATDPLPSTIVTFDPPRILREGIIGRDRLRQFGF